MRKFMQATTDVSRHFAGRVVAVGAAIGLALGLGLAPDARAGAPVFSQQDIQVTPQNESPPGDDHNTPSVAINPTNPAYVVTGFDRWDFENRIVDNEDTFEDVYSTLCGYTQSMDNGLTWSNVGTFGTPPQMDEEAPEFEGAQGEFPGVAYDSFGNAYYLCNHFVRNLASNETLGDLGSKDDQTLFVYRSNNNGQSWSPPNLALGDPGSNSNDYVQGRLAIDNGEDSACHGRIYVVAQNTENDNIHLNWSPPPGSAFQSCGGGSCSGRLMDELGSDDAYPDVAVAPDGTVFIAYFDGSDLRVKWGEVDNACDVYNVPSDSDDGFFVSGVNRIQFGPVRPLPSAKSYPVIGVDPIDRDNDPDTHRLHIVWAENPDGIDDSNIVMRTCVADLDANSLSCGGKIPVNQDFNPFDDWHSQFHQWMTTDPVTGDIFVTWLDDRSDFNRTVSDGNPSLVDLYGAFSSGSPVFFGGDFRIGDPPSSDVAGTTGAYFGNSELSPPFSRYFGNYTGNDFLDGTAIPAWTKDVPDFSQEIFVELNGEADLEITKEAALNVVAGDKLIYTITVTNHGPGVAFDVVVTDDLPPGTIFHSDDLANPECFDVVDPIACNLGDIEPGDTVIFHITVTVDQDYLFGQTPSLSIENTAEVTSNTTDPDETNNEDTVVTSIFESADLRVNKSCKPHADPDSDNALQTVGQVAICNITIFNAGPSGARNVTVSDFLWSDGVFTVLGGGVEGGTGGDVGPCDPDIDGYVCIDVGDLGFGDSAVIQVNVTADDPIDVNDEACAFSVLTDDPNSANDCDNATVTFTRATLDKADLLLEKECVDNVNDPNILLVGEIGVCTITVFNNGPDPAINVTMTDLLTSSTFLLSSAHVSAFIVGGGACDEELPSNSTVKEICDLGTIDPGQQKQVEVRVDPDDPMDVDDIAMVSSLTTDPDPNNNTDTDTQSFVELADLEVYKDCKPDDPLAVTEQGNCTIQITNWGPSPARNVTLIDTHISNANFTILDADVWPPLCTVTPDGTPSNSVEVECFFTYIDVNDTRTVVINITEDDPKNINDRACASSDVTDDPNTDNNCDEDGLTFEGRSNLNVTKYDYGCPDINVTLLDPTDCAGDPNPVVLPGDILMYVIEVENLGPSDAENVVVTDTLPSGVAFKKALDTVGDPTVGCAYVEATHTVTCGLDTIAANSVEAVFIFVEVLPGLTSAGLVNSACATSDVLDPDNSTACDTESTGPEDSADLWIDKTGNFPTGNPSTTMIVFLTINNFAGCSQDDNQVCGVGGPSDAEYLVVDDLNQFPVDPKKIGIVFVSEECTVGGPNNLVVECEDSVPFGQSNTHEIHIQVKGGVKDFIDNEACIVDVEPGDWDPENNCDTYRFVQQGGSDKPGGPQGGRGRGKGR